MSQSKQPTTSINARSLISTRRTSFGARRLQNRRLRVLRRAQRATFTRNSSAIAVINIYSSTCSQILPFNLHMSHNRSAHRNRRALVPSHPVSPQNNVPKHVDFSFIYAAPLTQATVFWQLIDLMRTAQVYDEVSSDTYHNRDLLLDAFLERRVWILVLRVRDERDIHACNNSALMNIEAGSSAIPGRWDAHINKPMCGANFSIFPAVCVRRPLREHSHHTNQNYRTSSTRQLMMWIHPAWRTCGLAAYFKHL